MLRKDKGSELTEEGGVDDRRAASPPPTLLLHWGPSFTPWAAAHFTQLLSLVGKTSWVDFRIWKQFRPSLPAWIQMEGGASVQGQKHDCTIATATVGPQTLQASSIFRSRTSKGQVQKCLAMLTDLAKSCRDLAWVHFPPLSLVSVSIPKTMSGIQPC